MALPNTGEISLKDVNVELKKTDTSKVSLNDENVRKLADKSSGIISMNDLKGKFFDPESHFKELYGDDYKGIYDESKTYNIDDVVSMFDLEEALCFEVTIPYNREDPNLKEFQKFYKIEESMAFRKIREDYWDILFEKEEKIDFNTTTFIEGQREYSSTVDNYYPYSKIKRVLLKNGIEQYELHDKDSTKKKDGSTAKLDGTDGDVMVRIPMFYGEVYVNANGDRRNRIYNYENPTKKIALGVKVHPAFVNPKGGYYKNRYNAAYFGSLDSNNTLRSINGVKPKNSITISQSLDYSRQGRSIEYHITSMIEWSTTHFLYTVEFAHLNSQEMIGEGYKYLNTTGSTNVIGNGTGKMSNGRNSYRGIEDLIGSGYYWIIGFHILNQSFYYTNELDAYMDTNKMKEYKPSNTGYPRHCIKNVENISGIEHLLIPKEETGDSDYSRYYCDLLFFYWNANYARFPQGGDCSSYESAGLAFFYCDYSASVASGSFGCRLSYCAS